MAEAKSGGVTVTGILEEIADEFCNNYCKWQQVYCRDEDEDSLEEQCVKCPLNRI